MNRRDFIQRTGAAAALLALPSVCRAAPPASRIVDTHTHFYDPTRKEGVPWPDKGTSLYRTVLPADWRAQAEPHGVKETVVVEASAWAEDNQWILDLAANEKCIIGFVGNLKPWLAEFPQQLKRFAANPLYRGIRLNTNVLDRMDHADHTDFTNGIKLLAELDLELEFNGAVPYANVLKLTTLFPTLRIVIDHVGSAGDPSHLSPEWLDGMKALGAAKNVFCKVSALTEQTDQSSKTYGSAPRDTAYYKPILDYCWQSFGEDKLIYGSNWPVSEKGGTYADLFKIVSEYFSDKGRDACEKYFWKNAQAAYRWKQ